VKKNKKIKIIIIIIIIKKKNRSGVQVRDASKLETDPMRDFQLRVLVLNILGDLPGICSMLQCYDHKGLAGCPKCTSSKPIIPCINSVIRHLLYIGTIQGEKVYGRNQYLLQDGFPVKDHDWWLTNLKELSEMQIVAETTGDWKAVDAFMKTTVCASFTPSHEQLGISKHL
jgi:hypothetical protein